MKNIDIIVSISADPCPRCFTQKILQIIAKGKNVGFLTSFLTLNKEFVGKMKEHTFTCLKLLKKTF